MQTRKIRNPIHHSPSNRSNPSSPTHPYPPPFCAIQRRSRRCPILPPIVTTKKNISPQTALSHEPQIINQISHHTNIIRNIRKKTTLRKSRIPIIRNFNKPISRHPVITRNIRKLRNFRKKQPIHKSNNPTTPHTT